jgi:glycosyltransferase involved in cell wall biosynthesis
MKRVLFFMHSSSPIGGVETWLDHATVHFGAHGFEPVVALVRGLKYNSPERYRQFHPDLPTIEVDGRGFDREGRVRALMRCMRSVRPSVVLPLGIVDANEAVIRSKLAGVDVRLLARAQGNLEPMLADLRNYRDWIDQVVCPGRLTRQVLVQWAGFEPGRVRNISNGADVPVAPRTARVSGAPLRLGYVGRLSQPDKRALDLVPLCRELERLGIDFSLDVVGDGPCAGDLRAGLQDWAAKVRFHGAMPREAIYRGIYPGLDALMMTSSSEAFGIVLVEAMMHGVVPVSSRYHGFRNERLVVEGETGLAFDVGDMAAAAQAVRTLQERPALLEALSAGATRTGLQYTWNNCMSKWQGTLERLVTQPVLCGRELPRTPERAPAGRLERIGLPPGLVDGVRRLRRKLLGPAVPLGGEEWPLYYRMHSPALLAEVTAAIERLECAAAETAAA